MSSTPSASVTNAFVDLASKQPIDDVLYGGKKCYAVLGREIQTISWFSIIQVPLKKEPQGESASYRYSRTADFLLHSWQTLSTPEIRVKKAYEKTHRIAMTPNLMHVINKGISLTFNDLTALTVDTVAIDQLAQHNEDPAKWDAYQKMIGNIPSLLTFGTFLPSKELKLPMSFLPWEKSVKNALPLCCLKLNEVRVNGDFQLELSKLIRVQRILDGCSPDDVQWENLKASQVNFSDIIEVKGGKPAIMPLPDVWAEYAMVTKPERKFHRDSSKDYLVEQVQRYTHKRESAGTHRFDFKFNYPMRSLYFNMLNQSAKEYNNHCNYTTNPHNADEGKDPVQHASLYYDNVARFERFPASHFSDIVPYYHHRRVPTETGYHAHSFSLTNGEEQDGRPKTQPMMMMRNLVASTL
jgi:hypothetical protein